MRYEIQRVLNLDSISRQILNPNSLMCQDGNTLSVKNSENRLYTSTNYTVNLNEQLTNVVDITVDTVEIPNSWYVFSNDYGTNHFQIIKNNNYIPITIQEGNYTETELINNLNTACSAYDLNFSYSSISNKITIVNNHTTQDISLNWYVQTATSACGASGIGSGSKIDYNLGWLLGFRTKSVEILSSGGSKTGTAPLDLHGPKYFLITLDDFNNNKPNKDLISIVDNQVSSFKLPSYFNTQTMDARFGEGNFYPGKEGQSGYECQDTSDITNNERACSTNDLNIDLRTNLTKAQEYTYNQIKLALEEKGVDRYFSPTSSDLLIRIPINRDPKNYTVPIVFKNSNPSITKRKYFGPVKLSKFKIKLLNDKGFEVNLNNRDWSFSIIITQLYQF